MPEKRSRDEAAGGPPVKKQKKGFQIGPANLPDGSWRRKNQRIKADLIEKAQIKKKYAKLLEKEQPEPSKVRYEDKEDGMAEQEQGGDAPSPAPAAGPAPASLELHPDRQQMVDEPEKEEERGPDEARPRRRKGKPLPFQREARQAQRDQAEAEERARRREEANKERERKLEERETFRRAMAKARTGGKNGQRKLGRESSVLLAKVKRMVGEA